MVDVDAERRVLAACVRDDQIPPPVSVSRILYRHGWTFVVPVWRQTQTSQSFARWGSFFRDSTEAQIKPNAAGHDEMAVKLC